LEGNLSHEKNQNQQGHLNRGKKGEGDNGSAISRKKMSGKALIFSKKTNVGEIGAERTNRYREEENRGTRRGRGDVLGDRGQKNRSLMRRGGTRELNNSRSGWQGTGDTVDAKKQHP